MFQHKRKGEVKPLTRKKGFYLAAKKTQQESFNYKNFNYQGNEVKQKVTGITKVLLGDKKVKKKIFK